MQLYAIDSKGIVVNAQQASRHVNYSCLECLDIVRLRGGPQRRCHFYHPEPTIFCRQHQKGPIHLHLQSYFLQQLPLGDCQLELSFPSIRRIADVAWLSQKIVFEIQCSPISAKEVLARNQDYQQMGWSVVWILHDQRYNQIRLSAAEIALRSLPHFFSNMNALGIGVIYDQFDICDQGIRRHRLAPLPIDFQEAPYFYSSKSLNNSFNFLQQRVQNWPYFFKGDLVDLFFKSPHASYLEQVQQIEKQFYIDELLKKRSQILAKYWQKFVLTPYQILFRFLLERMCR